MGFPSINTDRALAQRLIFIFFLIILWINYVSQVLLHQLYSPVLKDPGIDRAYWLYGLSGIPEFIINNFYVSLTIDIGLLIAAICSLIFPRSKRFPILFFICYILFFLTGTFYTGHYNNVGVLFMSIPFLFRNDKRVSNCLEAIRYYFLFIMVSACLWKLFRGSLFDVHHFSNILKGQHVEYFIFNQQSVRAAVVFYLINNPVWAFTCWIGLFILQFSFTIGFFTKKFDRHLLIAYLFFFAGSYFLMNITSIENVAFLFALLPLTFKMTGVCTRFIQF